MQKALADLGYFTCDKQGSARKLTVLTLHCLAANLQTRPVSAHQLSTLGHQVCCR
jgi:hypothetical protein